MILAGALFLALCLVPVVSAESSDTATSVDAVSGSIIINSAEDKHGESWDWSQTRKTLTISEDLRITGCIEISYNGISEQDITVNVKKDLSVTCYLGKQSAAIHTIAKSVTFTGGSINIDTISTYNGIESASDIIFKDLKSLSIEIGAIKSESGNYTVHKSCIHSDRSVEFDNVGHVSLKTPFFGIAFERDATIRNCNDFTVSLVPTESQILPEDAAGITVMNDGGGSITISNSSVTVTSTHLGFVAFECGYTADSRLNISEPKGNVTFFDQNINMVNKWDGKYVKSVVIDKDNGKAIVDNSGQDDTKLIVGIVCAVIIIILLLCGGYYYFRNRF